MQVPKVPQLEVHQGVLERQLHHLFPHEEILVNTKKEADIKNPSSGSYVEFDVWLPNINLAFEFQDHHHYTSTWYVDRPPESIQQSDNIKKHIALSSKNVNIVVVPCWWDGLANSLAATIHFERPELLASPIIHPISLNPPDGYFPLMGIPDVGELMAASFPTDVKFQSSIVPRIWWMGEKYDGVRCSWNPVRKRVYTRLGRIVEVTDQFKKMFPSIFTDGELWFGRGTFSFIHDLYHGLDTESVQWDLLRCIVFDTPTGGLQLYPFEERYRHLLASIDFENPFLSVALRTLCKDAKHLSGFVAEIMGGGGEGIVLRKVQSLYERGRGSSLFKLKASLVDKEGLIVDTLADGAVKLKLYVIAKTK